MIVQFSRASGSAIAAISEASTGRRGLVSSAACSVRSTTQASSGGGQLRPRQIGLQEFVGDDQPAALVAVEQMVPAGQPEVVHHLLSFASFARSTVSPGSSSPSTSRNENARIGLRSPRGRSVRNASLISPFSTVRWTATSISSG